MPKVNVYLPEDLAAAVRDAGVPVSAVCQAALERAVREVTAARAAEHPPAPGSEGDGGPYSRFTPRAREALARAEAVARGIPHDFVGTEHLLAGILEQGTNLAVRVLAASEIDPGDVRAELRASMPPPSPAPAADRPPFTPLASLALERTTQEALALGHNYVGCEHLLLGLLAVEDGLASRVLRRMGLELRTARRAVVNAIAGVAHARGLPPVPPAAPGPAGDEVLRAILERLDRIERRLG
ncbi:MAG: hypothetical protein KatS3mg009_2678 [Acidimicrobiia bacterium]|nr:MAG: hypothetical protein KatS3mg009_2678 [Acidimicrobiia bacterium]